MNILFIWSYGPLDVWRDKCVKRAMKIYPKANFICITADSEFYGMATVPFEHWIEKYNIPMSDMMGLSDYIRFDYLSENPDTLYLDTDTYCTKKMPFLEGIGYKSIEAIWNGKDLEGIKEIFSHHNCQQILWHLRDHMTGTYLHDYFEHKPLWAKPMRGKPIKPKK